MDSSFIACPSDSSATRGLRQCGVEVRMDSSSRDSVKEYGVSGQVLVCLFWRRVDDGGRELKFASDRYHEICRLSDVELVRKFQQESQQSTYLTYQIL